MNLIINILKTVPFFQSLNEAQHEAIAAKITEQFYPANYRLFTKGDLGEAMYIIKSGQVRIFDDHKAIATLKAGDFFGEMALIEAKNRNASAETLSECEVFLLKKDEFITLLEEAPEIKDIIGETFKDRKAQNSNQQ